MSSVHSQAMKPLPLGSIRPGGWLKGQLRRMADGLTGRLDEFGTFVPNSPWLVAGGTGDDWERVPYWLDGLVPLAWTLGDPALQAKAKKHLSYILSTQRADGWLGPSSDITKLDYSLGLDYWPLFIVLKILAQYAEATGDPDGRVVQAMLRLAYKIDVLMDGKIPYQWAFYRVPELVASLLWLHERTGEEWLLPMARRAVRHGYDWVSHMAEMPYDVKCPQRDPNVRMGSRLDNHGVNTAMIPKVPALLARLGLMENGAAVATRWLDELDRCHGQATGMFSGDESLGGTGPSQGVELCSVVEMMYGLETLLATFGDPAFGDRLEKIAFNALPAGFGPDLWTHLYFQQANQAVVATFEDPVFTTHGGEAIYYGFGAQCGCCTGNLHQGWPKLTASLWMRRGDGLAMAVIAPCEVDTTLPAGRTRLSVETEYPFSSTVRVTIHEAPAAEVPLSLRVPGWAGGARIRVNDQAWRVVSAGAFCELRARWQAGQTIELELPMIPRLERRHNHAATIHRGPLVYALRIGEQWKPRPVTDPNRVEPFCENDVHPTTPWNYALCVDETTVTTAVRFEQRPLGENPFRPDGAPVIAHTQGRRLPAWTLHHGAATPPPSPARTDQPPEDLTLIPYGCANLRMTELPTCDP